MARSWLQDARTVRCSCSSWMWFQDEDLCDSECWSSVAVVLQICLWNPETGLQMGKALTGHTKWITWLCWEPLHLWGYTLYTRIFSHLLLPHSLRVAPSISFTLWGKFMSPVTFVSTLSLKAPEMRKVWGHSLVRNPECRYLASSSKDGSLRIWDTVLGRCEKILTGHTQSVTCVKWGGDGLLYTSSQDRTVKVWRAKDVSDYKAAISPLPKWGKYTSDFKRALKTGKF